MIKKIVLENFMSYESASIEFDGSTIAVVGENGAGKSAFLEAIPYVYFGIGRENREGMSRIKGDGSHQVELWEDGNVMVKRGRKAGGAGYCEVRVAGELVGKGESANAWIVDHLGMNGDTYMLVSFYGLSDSHSDKLLRVLPSTRLESVQKLAQIGPYKHMLKKAKDRYDKSERTFDMEKARAEGAENAITDDKKLRDGLSAGIKLVVQADAKLKHLRGERHNLQIEEETYHAFVKEKERVGVERKSLRKEIETLEREGESLEDQISTDTDAMDENRKYIEQRTAELSGVDVVALGDRSGEIQQDSGAAQANLKLKKSALDVPVETAECPLCGQSITQDIIDAWETAVIALEAVLKSLYQEGLDTANKIELAGNLKNEVAALDRENKTLFADVQKYVKRVKIIDRDLAKLEGEMKRKDDRFVFLVEKLGDEYQGLQQKIQDVSDEIDVYQSRKHNTVGQMSQIKQSLKRNTAARAAIQTAKVMMAKCRKEMVSANLLKEAWSRYGIPLQLIERLNRRIEERSSAVYQEFDNGRIEVREVEDRGKPGIQFYLVDRKGARTFNQLSKGEKVMFFVAIRVAIAQIVAEDSPITVDYLILDEVMGNLSPKRRDDLIRLINKVLRKLFPQVIMVSHTEMRDIFSQTIRVVEENDVSVIEVV